MRPSFRSFVSTVPRASFSTDDPKKEEKSKYLLRFASALGRRETNEDYFASFDYGDIYVSALFDGHDSDQVSRYCSKNLEFWFKKLGPLHSEMEDLLREVVNALNISVLESQLGATSGSTALILAIDPHQDTIHIANVGDSRCVLHYRDGSTQQTNDHKPQIEAQRLKAAGAQVVEIDGVHRVNGVLAVSRSIGDGHLKNQGVTSEPDYYQFPLNGLCFIVAACDGLYDVVSTPDLVKTMNMLLCNKPVSEKDKKLITILQGEETIHNTKIVKIGTVIHQRLLFDNVVKTASIGKRLAQTLIRMAYDYGTQDNITVGVLINEACK